MTSLQLSENGVLLFLHDVDRILILVGLTLAELVEVDKWARRLDRSLSHNVSTPPCNHNLLGFDEGSCRPNPSLSGLDLVLG